MVSYEEAQNIFNQEAIRHDLNTELAPVFEIIDTKIRNRECEYSWSKKEFTVLFKSPNVNIDKLMFIAEEYMERGGFPEVLVAHNSILRTSALTFKLVNTETDIEPKDPFEDE